MPIIYYFNINLKCESQMITNIRAILKRIILLRLRQFANAKLAAVDLFALLLCFHCSCVFTLEIYGKLVSFIGKENRDGENSLPDQHQDGF